MVAPGTEGSGVFLYKIPEGVSFLPGMTLPAPPQLDSLCGPLPLSASFPFGNGSMGGPVSPISQTWWRPGSAAVAWAAVTFSYIKKAPVLPSC